MMPEPRTLIEMMALRGQAMPHETAFIFEDQSYSYGWLWQHANLFAARLVHHDVRPGDRVVLALPNGPAFFYAFYGALRQRAIAVPIFPGSDPVRCAALMHRCGARHLVVPHGGAEAQARSFQGMALEQGATLITATTDPLETSLPPFAESQADDVAFIQYTSGSTADPRGVVLTHRSLLTNVRQMIEGMEITPAEVMVSWLPVYHDMGLILKTMVPFYLGAKLVLLAASLRHVSTWLKAIEKYGGTFTAAPDSAYRLCVHGIRHPERYTLSSLRVVLNAAEPIRRQTMEDFEKAFGLRHVMVAGYGLAEATVGVCMSPPGMPKKVDTEGHVSVGPPFPGIDVKVVDGDGSLPPGCIGEIAVRSPANTSGYYGNPAASARLRWKGDYILTGDLGYVDDEGDLFVVSRKKNLIIQAGRSLYPADVEEVVDVLPEIRRVAAVGIERRLSPGEQLYLFAELASHRVPDPARCRCLIAAIVQRVHEHFGLRPGRVYLLKPKSLPLTPNGKLQHQRLKKIYLNHDLREMGCILYPDY